MNYKKTLKMAYIFFGISVVFFIALWIFNDYLFSVLAVVSGLAGAAFSLIVFKCPHCGRSLKLRTPMPPICPYCGNKLELNN